MSKLNSLYHNINTKIKLYSCHLDKIPLVPKLMNHGSVFIFTEVINCGKIGRIAIDSFVKYHPDAYLYVIGTPQDFKLIKPTRNLILIDITSHKALVESFNYGHFGTAMLWARLIKEREEKYFIHFDSDVIFRHEAISDILNAFTSGHDLVGYIRNYKHNPNNRDDVRHLPDLTQTAYFGFNRDMISNFSLKTLVRMCQGSYNPLKHPVIDFFDPVMFDILKNGGRISHLNSDDYGGCDYYGKRSKNNYYKMNQLIDFGEKLIHFSAVGSGMNFYEHPESIKGVPAGYQNYAIDKYALFCKLFYNETINYPVDLQKYKELLSAIRAND